MARTIGARVAAIARKEARPPHGTACGRNMAGTIGYFSSCHGNGGLPEFWCADFAKFVWAQAGALNTDVLTPAAASFADYGRLRRNNPKVGDAVLFNYDKKNHFAEHVAIVVRVNPDGTIVTIGGDERGTGRSQASFASTSGVYSDGPYKSRHGHTPPTIGSAISGYVSPVEDDMPYTKKEILDLVKKGVAAELNAGPTKREILDLVKKGVAAELSAPIGTSGITPAQGAKAAVHAKDALAGLAQQLADLTALVQALSAAMPPPDGTGPPARTRTPARTGTSTRTPPPAGAETPSRTRTPARTGTAPRRGGSPR